MILVDTNVWIDHLHRTDQRLLDILDWGLALSHPLILIEIASGTMRNRPTTLDWLARTPTVRVATHGDVLSLVERQPLWGRGLSATDLHLLTSVLITDGAGLWTRDKRLATVAHSLGVGFDPAIIDPTPQTASPTHP